MKLEGRNASGEYTFSEIQSQADSWRGVFRCLDSNLAAIREIAAGVEEILVAGCGSGCNIANSVAPFLQMHTGRTCRAVHASEIMINPKSVLNESRRNLVIVYSRSGNTTESCLALEKAKSLGAATLAVVCFADSRMARNADLALVLEDAVEKSVTTTRSFTSMVLAGYGLGAKWSGRDDIYRNLLELPGLAESKMEQFHRLGREIAADEQIRKYAFVGSGTFYGLAREAQLKMKEMVLLPSDSYVSLDYQHGPMSNVDRNMLVTILVSDAGRKYDSELAGNMHKLGGKTFILCDESSAGFTGIADYLLELNTRLPDGIRDILYMPALQFAAYYKSLAVGCDPDNPRNLSYHVELKDC